LFGAARHERHDFQQRTGTVNDAEACRRTFGNYRFGKIPMSRAKLRV
jgi:hypothetical protein